MLPSVFTSFGLASDSRRSFSSSPSVDSVAFLSDSALSSSGVMRGTPLPRIFDISGNGAHGDLT